jgi:hypothetical protein
MKSKQEIELLKSQWLEDPIWDIEDTLGFEEHREELQAFQKEQNQRWEAQRAALQPDPIHGFINHIRQNAKHEQEQAAKLLCHYFSQSIQRFDADSIGEINDIVQHIVQAAVLQIKAELLTK